MRRARWTLAALFALAVCVSADAQSANVPKIAPSGFSSAMTGIKPTDVQFRQIDTNKLLRAPGPVVQQVQAKKFSFGSFLRKITGIGSAPVRGVSPLPNPKTVPGWQFQNSPIKPMKPILPTPVVQ